MLPIARLVSQSHPWAHPLTDAAIALRRICQKNRAVSLESPIVPLLGIYFDCRSGAWNRCCIVGPKETYLHPLPPPDAGQALAYFRYSGTPRHLQLEDRGPYHVAAFFRRYATALGAKNLQHQLLRDSLSSSTTVRTWMRGESLPHEGMRAIIAGSIAKLSGEMLATIEDQLECAYSADIGCAGGSGKALRRLTHRPDIQQQELLARITKSIGYAQHWIMGRQFPSPVYRLRIVWGLATYLQQTPEAIWEEIHRDELRPRPLPVILGSDVTNASPTNILTLLAQVDITSSCAVTT